MKQCNKCLVEKEFTSFWKRKSSQDGYQNTCKQCLNEYKKDRKEISKQELIDREIPE